LAKRDLVLPQAIKRLARSEALLIDDLGYVRQDQDEIEVLFTLLAERYERGSVLITSNLPFSRWGAFQYMAILHEDRVTGMRDGARDFGLQIEIRCWDSVDARTATPTRLPWEKLEGLSARILDEVPGVVSVTYAIAPKPPSTMEVV
jgi:hypothetical protein